MARRAESAATVEETTPEPWVEDGFRYLVNEHLGGFHRCPDTGEALASFYGRGWVDAPRPAAPEPPAPSADAWVEDGFRNLTHPATDGTTRVADAPASLQSFYEQGWVDAARPTEVEVENSVDAGGWVQDGFRLLVHPQSNGSTRVPNTPSALAAFYESGWVDAAAPAPVEETTPGPGAGGVVDSDGFRVLTHPGTGGETRVPNTVDARAAFHEQGWVDAEPSPADDPGQVLPDGGWVDEDGFRYLTHPDTGGETRAPNTAEALAPFYARGWVDAGTTTPEPAPDEPAPPGDTRTDIDPPPHTEPPAVTATTEKE